MPARNARLVSVNVGMPREVSWQGRIVVTGIWKDPVQGARQVRRLNIDGDGQGDRAGHGGEQRGVRLSARLVRLLARPVAARRFRLRPVR
jgi:MOSC domain-containing protein YiiM